MTVNGARRSYRRPTRRMLVLMLLLTCSCCVQLQVFRHWLARPRWRR